MTLKAERVQEVRHLLELLDAGEPGPDGRRLSMRRIGELTRISRTTIAAIANGTRPDPTGRTGRPRSTADERRHSDELNLDFFRDIFEGSLPPDVLPRCPVCGVRTELPCRACAVKALLRAAGVRYEGRWPPALRLGLDLRPADHARYLAVRAAKVAAERERDAAAIAAGVELEPDEGEDGFEGSGFGVQARKVRCRFSRIRTIRRRIFWIRPPMNQRTWPKNSR